MVSARNVFGGLAFGISALVIGFALSNFVPIEKKEIVLIVLGNVLGWPSIVLAYHFGTSAGSVRKTELLGKGEDE